jgi:predicted PhzF superfamily epimerase YddE/YHI9
LSERELLVLHTEIKALQEQYGIQYKDAAHRLYLAEIAKLQALDDARSSFQKLIEIVEKDINQAGATK